MSQDVDAEGVDGVDVELSVWKSLRHGVRCVRKKRGIRKVAQGDVAPRPPTSMLCIVCVGEAGCREINDGKFQRRCFSYTSTLKVGHGVPDSHVQPLSESVVFFARTGIACRSSTYILRSASTSPQCVRLILRPQWVA